MASLPPLLLQVDASTADTSSGPAEVSTLTLATSVSSFSSGPTATGGLQVTQDAYGNNRLAFQSAQAQSLVLPSWSDPSWTWSPTGFCVNLVMYMPDANSGEQVFGFVNGGGQGDQTYLSLGRQMLTSVGLLVIASSSGQWIADGPIYSAWAATGASPAAAHVYTFNVVVDPATGYARIDFYLDGLFVQSSLGSSAFPSGGLAAPVGTIGSATAPTDMVLYELDIYNGPLTPQAIAGTVVTLAGKWGASVAPLPPQVTALLNGGAALSLSADTQTFALGSYFSAPQAGGLPLSFYLTANPFGSASLTPDGQSLVVTGDYRSSNYPVVVGASNAFGLSNSDTLRVAEATAQPPTQPQLLGSVGFSNPFTAAYGLSNYFSDPQGSALTFSSSVNNPAYAANASLDQATGALSVSGGWTRSNSYAYSVVVTASNAYGKASSGTLAVTQAGTTRPSTTSAAVGPGSVSLSNQTVAFGLSNNFTDPQGSALSYWLTADPYGSASISPGGALTVTGAYRGAGPYTVSALASNAYGQSAVLAASIQVSEPTPGAPVAAEYPPAPLTAATTTLATPYGAGTYAATASEFAAGSAAYGAFTLSPADYPAAMVVENRISLGTATFSNSGLSTSNYALSNFFTDPLLSPAQVASLQYVLKTNPLGTASVDQATGTLTVSASTPLTTNAAGYAGARYPVTVLASNASVTMANTLQVVEAVAPAIRQQLGSNMTFSNNTPVAFGLSNYFYDTMQTGLSYWITPSAPAGYSTSTPTSQLTSNLSLSNAVLTVTSKGTGNNFVAQVAGSNAYGLLTLSTFSFFEKIPFTPVTLTPCGRIGRSGPTAAMQEAAYASQPWWSRGYVGMSATQGYQTFTVPITGTYTITAAGAQGGSTYQGGNRGGYGRVMSSQFQLTQGTVLTIVVGQIGNPCFVMQNTIDWPNKYIYNYAGSGGGGTYVFGNSSSTAYIIAGGGGGALQASWNILYSSHGRDANGATSQGGTGAYTGSPTNGYGGYNDGYAGGGAGFFGNGQWTNNGLGNPGGRSVWDTLEPGFGGVTVIPHENVTSSSSTAGGFGGGGGAGLLIAFNMSGGGGGGYTGGGVSGNMAGGGGGCYATGTNLTDLGLNNPAIYGNDGYVTITFNNPI